MAKWSSKWSGEVEEVTVKPYHLRYKDDKLIPKYKRKGRSSKPNGTHRYETFFEALKALWDYLFHAGYEDIGIYIEFEGKKLVEIVKKKDSWQFYAVRFRTPPALTNQVIKAIKEGKLKRPYNMFD